MADDDLDEDFDPDAIDEEIDESAIDDDVIEDVLDDDALVTTDVLEEPDKVEDPVAPVEEPAARTKKRTDEEEDDEEELDPDDVEADLDTILKDRIAAADEDEDDEELDEPARTSPDAPNGVVPKRANEFMCTGCFLLVNRGQFGREGHLQCPVGESECPAIDELQSAAPAKPARTGRKR